MNITKEEIDAVLVKIKEEITTGQYKLPQHLMGKVEEANPIAEENKRYIQGEGGYYYQLLPLLVRHLAPQIIVELGSSYGVSALMMYSELADTAKLITVDIEKDIRLLPEVVLGDKRFQFVLGDDLDINIFGSDIPFGIDILYIDTFHFAQQVKDEFDVYKYLLADKALVIMDDIHYKDTGELFFDSPFAKWDVTELYHKSGFGIMLFERPADFPKTREEAYYKAALTSAHIGHRKFHNLHRELENGQWRKQYAAARMWAARHKKAAGLLRQLVRPVKKLITPTDKPY